MFQVEFYEDAGGHSDVREFLEELQQQIAKSKDARIQYQQLVMYIDLLQRHGTQLSNNIVKLITDDIWELRPGNNRVFFFYFRNDTYVLLHHFRKKSQQTPAREIRRAQNERDDYIARKEREA
jgi:phage-related protein